MAKSKKWEPSDEEQDHIRETLDEAIGYTFELYPIKQMAIDSGLTTKEAKWAEDNIYFKAHIFV